MEGAVMAIQLPEIVRELNISEAAGNLAMTLLIATSGAVLVAVGRLADRFGRRRLCLVGIGLALAATIGVASSWDAASLLIARSVQGVANAMILTAVALLNHLFSSARGRSLAYAWFGAAMGVGLALAPLVGAAALDAGNWRFAFWINIPILLVCLAGVWCWVPEKRAAGAPETVDVMGTVLLAGALLLALISISEGPRLGWWVARPAYSGPWPFAVSIAPILMIVSLALFFCFGAVERWRLQRGLASLMDPTLLSVRSFGLGCAVSFLFVLGGFALQFIIPLSGIYFWHMNTGAAGLLTALMGIGIAAGGWTTLPLARHLGARSVVVLGIAIMIIGTSALWGTMAWNPILVGFSITLVAFGVGYGMTYSRITEITLADVPAEKLGLASGMLVASRTCAMALGAAGLTSIIGVGRDWGSDSSTPIIAVFGQALILSAVALLTALSLALLLRGGNDGLPKMASASGAHRTAT